MRSDYKQPSPASSSQNQSPTDIAVGNVGILRLRDRFAWLRARYAQDDIVEVHVRADDWWVIASLTQASIVSRNSRNRPSKK
jgi:hypothetical protein